MSDGKLLFETALDTKGLTTGLDTVKSAATTAFEVSVKAVAAVSGALSTGAAAAIKVGTSFETSMSQVAAISGATGDELQALTDKAKAMGAATKFSASESADAMTYMAMAGWKTEDMLSGIAGIMDLAAASGEDLATTSDIVTDALTAFGLTAQDSTHFADILAAASSNANTNVSMMGETFKYVAPVAGALGFSAEDCATAIGLMANSGIKASQAGTSLRSIMSRLTSPTDDVQTAMDALGVSMTNSDGTMKSLNDIILDLREGFAGLTEAEQAQMASDIAGQEAMSGLLAIVNASDSDFTKLQESIYGCDGAAAQMADTMQDNLQGKITILKSALEGLGIDIYESMESALSGAADLGNEYIDELSTAFEEGGPEGLANALGSILADVVTRAAEFAPQLVDLAVELIKALAQGIIDNLPQLFEAAEEIADTILDGIGDLCPALDPVTDALKKIIEHLDDVALAAGAAAIVFAGLKAGMAIQSAVKGFQEAQLAIALFKASTEGANIAQAALNGTLTVGEAIVALLTGKMTLAELASAGLAKAQTVLNGVMSANPVTLIVLAIAALVAIFVVLWNKCDWFREFWSGLWENIQSAASDVIDAIVGFFTETIPNAVDGFVDFIKNNWQTLLMLLNPATMLAGIFKLVYDNCDAFREFVDGFIENIKNAVTNAWDSLVQWVSELPETIMYWLGFILTSLILWGQDLINWAATAIPEFAETIVTFFSELPEKIAAFFGKILADLAVWASNMVAEAVETGTNFRDSIVTFFSQLPERIATLLGKVIGRILSFAAKMRERASDAGKGFFDNIVAALKDLPSRMSEIGKHIVDGIWTGISGGWDWLTGQVKKLADSLFQGAKDALEIHSPSKKFKWLGEMCVEGMDAPLADYNPYETLQESMDAGVIRPELFAGAAVTQPGDAVRNTAGALTGGSAASTVSGENIDYEQMGAVFRRSVDGMTVSMDGRPVGKVIAPYVNDEIGKINGRRT